MRQTFNIRIPRSLNSKVTQAVFTESNRNIVNTKESIPGLNLGINTNAPDAIIQNNLTLLFAELGWDIHQLATANQVHGSNIQIINKPGIYDNTDGLITKAKNLALGIRVADCAAVLIADPSSEVIGAFHAGWKGAAGNIIPKGITKMISLGADTDQMIAYVSPCISKSNFEVGEEVASKFPDEFVDRVSYTKPHVDLKAFILQQLIQGGLKKLSIEVDECCTVEDDQFYSYRRERSSAGRMLALIKLKD